MKKLQTILILTLFMILSCRRDFRSTENNILYIPVDSSLTIKYWDVSIIDSFFVFKTLFKSLPDSFITDKIFNGDNILGLEYYFDLDRNKKSPGGNFYITLDYPMVNYNDTLVLCQSNYFKDSSIIYFYQLALDESKFLMNGPYGNIGFIRDFRSDTHSNIFNERKFIGDTLVLKLKYIDLKNHFNPFIENSQIGIRLRTNLKDNLSRFGNDKSIKILDKK